MFKKKIAISLERFDGSLWKDYLSMAQIFWLPKSMYSVSRFSMMVIMLSCFVAASLFGTVMITGYLWNALSPETLTNYAPAFIEWINGVRHSKVFYLLLAGIFVPGGYFGYYSKELRPYLKPWLFLGALLLLSFSVSGINVVMSYVGRFFQTALAKKDVASFWKYLYVYATVFVIATPIVVIYTYLRRKLGMLWREWLTTSFLDQYFSHRAYYELTSSRVIDNPDQRIADDLKSFTITSLDFLLIILGAIVDLIAFMGILYSISQLLSGVLLVYALFGTTVTILIGKRLVGINYQQLRKEADFRYGLIHMRDHAESIAFYRGEDSEKNIIQKRFKSVLNNFAYLIGWQRNLEFFTTSYDYLIRILPIAIIAPLFFADKIEFGQISQASMAFSHVLVSFSIIVRYFEQISAFAAGINRVADFKKVLSNAQGIKGAEFMDAPRIQNTASTSISATEVTLQTPDYTRTLVEGLSFDLEQLRSILVVGHSGVGKSSLLRGIAGLWNSGKGKMTHPQMGNIMFLPQRPYMVLGTLRDQFLYPNNYQCTDQDIFNAIDAVNLGPVFQKMADSYGGKEKVLDREEKWEEVFSLGEQQRLAFARLLLSKPAFAILDEASSALDVENEKNLYQILSHQDIRFISVGHRPTLTKYHQHVLALKGDGRWEIQKADEYRFE